MPLRKRAARLLRTSANRLDPPKPATIVATYTTATSTLGSLSIKGTPDFYLTNRMGI